MTLHELCVVIYVGVAGLVCAALAGVRCGALYSISGFIGGVLHDPHRSARHRVQELHRRRRKQQEQREESRQLPEPGPGDGGPRPWVLVWSIRAGCLAECRMRCAYCHQDFTADVARSSCASCGTVLHADCRAALAACPTLGCVEASRQTAGSIRREKKGGRTWPRRLSRVTAPLGLGVLFTFLSGHGQSAEIRLDTGDLRYCWFGVPYSSTPMPEPLRSKILSVTNKSPETNPPEWRTVATFPLPTSNNSHSMCQGFYVRAAAWIDADPEVARLVFEDIGDYVLATNARYSLPACSEMLSPFDDLIDYETGRIHPNWRSNLDVQGYLARKREAGGTSRLYFEARASWVPLVLRVRHVRVNAADEDLVEVLRVIQDVDRRNVGSPLRVAHRGGKDGVPPGVSTIYLERPEDDESPRWMLFGGGASNGVSHHAPE